MEARTVYVVEDSPLVSERLLEMLGALPGTRVVGHATRADDAIRGILAERPDVVVLDVRLAQGSSGFDVLRRVHDLAPEIEVYMLSGFSSDPYRRLARQLGARGFFDKATDIGCVRDAVAARAAQPH